MCLSMLMTYEYVNMDDVCKYMQILCVCVPVQTFRHLSHLTQLRYLRLEADREQTVAVESMTGLDDSLCQLTWLVSEFEHLLVPKTYCRCIQQYNSTTVHVAMLVLLYSLDNLALINLTLTAAVVQRLVHLLCLKTLSVVLKADKVVCIVCECRILYRLQMSWYKVIDTSYSYVAFEHCQLFKLLISFNSFISYNMLWLRYLAKFVQVTVV